VVSNDRSYVLHHHAFRRSLKKRGSHNNLDEVISFLPEKKEIIILKYKKEKDNTLILYFSSRGEISSPNFDFTKPT
jgi:hypothetical protein